MKGFFYSHSDKLARKVPTKKPAGEKRPRQARELGCDACGLHRTCHSPRMAATGRGEKGIFILAESPGQMEDEQGVQLVGQTGQVLRRALSSLGIDLDRDCWKSNSIQCRPPENRKPRPVETDSCRLRVWAEIERHKPKVIIALGNEAAKCLYGHRWKKDFPGITTLRGWAIPDQDLGTWVCPTFHPSYVLRSEYVPSVGMVFRQDLKKAVQHARRKFPSWAVPEDKVRVLFDPDGKDEKEFRHLLTKIMDEGEPASFDYETTGLKPYKPGHRIVTCSIATNRRCLAFPMTKMAAIELKARFLANPNILKCAHRIAFEENWSRQILQTRVRGWHLDTRLAAHHLDNRAGINGLKFQVLVRFGIPDYDSKLSYYLESGDDDSHSFNRIDQAPMDQLLMYNGLDAHHTNNLACIQIAELGAMVRGNGYGLLHDGLAVMSDIEDVGIAINLPYCREQEKHLTRRIDHATRRIMADPKVAGWKKKQGDKFNLNSPPQLRNFLFDDLKLTSVKETAKQNASVDKDSLEALAGDVPFVNDLVAIRNMQKARDTYLKNWQREAVNGRLHPFFHLDSVATFRSSCSRPNLQNVPVRDEEIQRLLRTAIIPSPGRQLLEADFKGIEVGVSACYHKDPTMIEYIKDPSKDMHRDMAMQMFFLNKDQVTKEIRHLSKNGFVFPEFYGSYYAQVAPAIWDGMRKRKLALEDETPLEEHLRYASIMNGREFEDHIKKVERDFWGRRFRVYAEWKDAVERDYLRKGYLELLTGFRCCGPLDRKQISNYPIQGSAFHCLLWVMIRLGQIARERGWVSQMVSQIHDSMIWDLVPSERDEIVAAIREVVEKELPRHWPWIVVPMRVEMEIAPVGKSWYEKEEMK